MKINDRIAGFFIKEVHELSGLMAALFVMEHEKTGARLVYLQREEENKTFSIAFKTLPHDSTGVFHIIEHSVLCGSEKYRLKDPFVELLCGSLNTFLNAMTFNDKTMYPVASTNEKEFLSLTDVYLDAVFNPLAVRDKKAFMQEGWHYEIDGDGNLSYKGVVLNEMRGDYSSPESVADRHIHSMLFDGTCYAHDSGGDPAEITELTFEQYKKAHETYYHPSNATVFLDGTMDIEKALSLISGYFDKYDKINTSGDAFDFKPAAPKRERREVEYEISETEEPKDKTRLALAHLTFRFDEREKIFGAAILSSALFSSNESKIKKKILASRLCEDLQLNIGEGIYQNYFEVDFINIKDGKESELESLFYQTVADVSRKGIDKEELIAAVNSLEFSLRERDYGTLPLGIIYAMNLMETYLYSEDAVSGLTFEDEIKFLRDNIGGSFFEKLLSEIFITNESRIALVMRPSSQLGENQRREERLKLNKIKALLSESDILRIRNENKMLSDWQSSADSEDAKRSIPRLGASDIPREVNSVPTIVSSLRGASVVTHPIATNGICYTELYFDVSELSPREVFTSALIGLLLGNVSTENHSAAELNKILKSEIGTFSAALTPMTNISGDTKVYFKVFISCLASKKKRAAELLSEILTRSSFTEKDAVENIIKQTYIASEEAFAAAGHRAARGRASAKLSQRAAVLEYYSGYEAHKSYKSLAESFDGHFDNIRKDIEAFIDKYLVRERLTLSVAEDNISEGGGEFAESICEIFKPSGKAFLPKCSILPLEKKNEGIIVPAKVSFSAFCASVPQERDSELGLAHVASNFVSYEYLWSEIRVKGGAYGAGMSAVRTGLISFYSYRDPSPKRSVECMAGAPEFLSSAMEKIINDGGDIDKYIIGAIGETSPYMTPRAKANIGTVRYLTGITERSRRELRGEILSATPEKLLAYAERAKKAAADGVFCIVAPKAALDKIGLDSILKI